MELRASVNSMLIDRSCSLITHSGIEQVQRRPTIFLSNHSDIVREPAGINYVLAKEQLPVAYVGMGSNLYRHPLLWPIIALQPNFSIPRQEGRGRHIAMRINSLLDEGKNIWIAQSKGRSRTGDFRTEITILPGLAKARGVSIQQYCETFNIVPVAVSAAYEPAAEIVAKLAAKQRLPWWSDIESIVRGTVGYKGDMHIAFNAPISGTGKPSEVSNAIDTAIHQSYKCFSTHAQAYDERKHLPIHEWSTAPVNFALIRDSRLRQQIQQAPRELQPRIVSMYAYPFKNSMVYQNSL